MKLFLTFVLLTTTGLTTLTAPASAQDQEKQKDAFFLENNLKPARNPAGLRGWNQQI